MLPREHLPPRGSAGTPPRRKHAFRVLGLATAALLMTACSPAVFHPAPVGSGESHAAPAFATNNGQAIPAEREQGAAEQDTGGPGEDDAVAPLPALAAEVRSVRETQREAVAEGASALEAAHQEHLAQLAAEEERLEREHAEAEAELDRQRLEDQAAEEAAQAEEEAAAEREEDSEAEAPTEDTPAPDAPVAEEPAPQEPEQTRPETPSDAPVFAGNLDHYLEQLAEHHPGDISISVAELGGQARTGSAAGAESRVSASTYKVFVAYGILSRVESSEMDWDDPIDGGRDRATCLNEMISVSDNPCADVFRGEIGWEGLRDIAAETGGPATDFIPAYARTSANDLTAFMTALESGALNLSPESRSRLLGALESNIFREGIGAGSAGSVLNKVGFIDGYLNDTAIVRHPQGTYVLSIMSEGSDWNAISAITRDIEAALY
ncbi:serine hydrolase [Nesterenkonia sandarakina]|uniref:Beta-lactamase class A n=1 Tax=Nesterenkonia sandarakina TaxID=272918 RepID=A0A7Z0EBR3_9MICC|nr:serine hydrolase [Nesterenkonia sandarakina]NYJ17987.1 beta-lactamase class A [Nesterenkonia sandarakina]